MKTEKGYGIYFIVHAVSTLDLELLTQILTPLAHSVSQKAEVSQILFEFNYSKTKTFQRLKKTRCQKHELTLFN